MQELVTGMEKIRFDSEANVEELGAHPLTFPGVDSECSDKDCPLLHVAASTASPVGCPWYDRGFCRHGPLCKYKHTRREMCANYLVGFCPEGPKCKFVHLKAGLMTSSTDPSKEAACPWGLVQRDLAAAEERGGRATQGATSMWHPAPASSSVGHQWLSPEPTEPAGTRQLLQGKKNATGHDGHCTNPVGFARHQLTVGTGSTGITPCHENWDFPQLAAPPGTAGCGQAGAAAAFPRFERVQDWLVPGSSAQG
ncbi:putative cleavage and polyadenylation specificity factor subunit 4-like protein isoform X2 [Chamaea fasciata]|uniref:putative cleavage and polyadenylation specificity factor subunit 4-like protein isoform X2 n=1 Tax=Chamaea fasciata TaxID=190680 RepID=UPI00336A17FD